MKKIAKMSFTKNWLLFFFFAVVIEYNRISEDFLLLVEWVRWIVGEERRRWQDTRGIYSPSRILKDGTNVDDIELLSFCGIGIFGEEIEF